MRGARNCLAVGVSVALLALPAVSFAQSYYYPSGNMYGGYAAPYQYYSYGYPYSYQTQYQQQYQSNYSYPMYSYPYAQYSYPSYNYGYSYPNYHSMPSYSYSSNYPYSYSYPLGTYGPFGTQMCYWSDYPTYASCGQDPQQWIQDPYTGQWY